MKRVAAIIVGSLLLAANVCAQVSASAGVPIRLKIPGSITLNLKEVPVSIAIQEGTQQQFQVPLSVSWNLDPREVQGFRIVGRVANRRAALVNDADGFLVPSSSVLSRWLLRGESSFASTDEDHALFQMAILPYARRGNEQGPLQLKISDEELQNLSDGNYNGVLYLEVISY